MAGPGRAVHQATELRELSTLVPPVATACLLVPLNIKLGGQGIIIDWFAVCPAGGIYKMRLDGTIVGKFGRAGKLLKEFGTVNAIDCRTENVLYVGEVGNFRVQKLTLR